MQRNSEFYVNIEKFRSSIRALHTVFGFCREVPRPFALSVFQQYFQFCLKSSGHTVVCDMHIRYSKIIEKYINGVSEQKFL